VNSQFQQNLKQISFKTFHHNQTKTFGYDDLFANRRAIIFSITNFRTTCSTEQLCGYADNFKQFKELGVDEMYVVDSTDWLIGPYIDRRFPDLKGLPDRDMEFVRLLADHYEYTRETLELAKYWQYVIIINNGEPEKLWHNPFNANAPLRILKAQDYRYRKLSADNVLQYLVDNNK
jgi:peroxiredoxin